MSFGHGNINFTNNAGLQKASDGTSAKDGSVQLGNLFGDPLQPAILTDSREIPMDGHELFFKLDADNYVKITENELRVVAAALNRYVSIVPGNITITEGDIKAPSIAFTTDSIATSAQIVNLNGEVWIANNGLDYGAIFSIITKLFSVPDAIQTGDPNTGAGQWKLGKQKAAAVTLDAANYIEVKIDGVVRKLALVN